MTPMRPTIRRFLAPAFTLIELLVVIAIISIALSIMLPSYGRMVESTNYASSVNLVTATLGNARAHAIRSGRHTAVAFMYDLGTRQGSMVVLELSGSQGGVLSTAPGGPPGGVYAQVFRPIPNTVPIELPKGTAVMGLAFTHVPKDIREESIDRDTAHWYAGELIANRDRNIVPWIFPRNDPRNFIPGDIDTITGQPIDPWKALVDVSYGSNVEPRVSPSEAATAVRHAATFCIQFSPEGTVVTTTPSGGDETLDAFIDLADDPRDLSDPNGETFDDPLVFDPEIRDASANNPSANPEVVLRSANLLAVVDIGRMIKETGFNEPWFLRPQDSRAADLSGKTVVNSRDVIALSDWVDGNGELIGFNRYTGNVIRRVER